MKKRSKSIERSYKERFNTFNFEKNKNEDKIMSKIILKKKNKKDKNIQRFKANFKSNNILNKNFNISKEINLSFFNNKKNK